MSEHDVIALTDLPLFWEGRARALQILQDRASRPDTHTATQIETIRELMAELSRALAASGEKNQQETWALCLPWSYDPGQGASHDHPEMTPAVGDADGKVIAEFVSVDDRDEIWRIKDGAWSRFWPDVIKALNYITKRTDGTYGPDTAPVEAKPVAWRHKHWPNEPWQYRETPTFGTPYPYYEPLYASPSADLRRALERIANRRPAVETNHLGTKRLRCPSCQYANFDANAPLIHADHCDAEIARTALAAAETK